MNNYPFQAINNIANRLGYNSAPNFNSSAIEGINIQNNRLNHHGGRKQQERMIKDKRRSLDRALLYSYQAGFVKKYYDEWNLNELPMEETLEQPPVRALINPDKNKQDYDDKIISIGYEHGFKPGDIFEWVNTDTHWLIYLQDKTELAYFRGEIRRCRYTIRFKDENNVWHTTYAAIRGPVETKINYIQKHMISVDEPNHSLNILLPYSEYTVKYFDRYANFYVVEDDRKICWRVEASDWLSTPGILEVVAVEYYANKFEDDIENGVVGGLILPEDPVNTDRIEKLISGETFIKPKGVYEYRYTGLSLNGSWKIDKNKYPIEYKQIDDRTIQVKWLVSYSGQFDIFYGDNKKTIIVESLF